jgi:hypothetical protein
LSEKLYDDKINAEHLRHVSDGRLGAGVQQATAPVREENAQLRAALAAETAKVNFIAGQRETDRVKIASLETETARIAALEEKNAHLEEEKQNIQNINARLIRESAIDHMEIDRLVGELEKRRPYAVGEPKIRVQRTRRNAIARCFANYLRALMGVARYDEVPLYADGDILTYSDLLGPVQAFAEARGMLKPLKACQLGMALKDIGIVEASDGIRSVYRDGTGARRVCLTFNIARTVAALQRSSF